MDREEFLMKLSIIRERCGLPKRELDHMSDGDLATVVAEVLATEGLPPEERDYLWLKLGQLRKRRVREA